MRRCEIEAAKGNLCQGVLKPLYRGYFQPKELARGELFAPSLSVNVLAGSRHIVNRAAFHQKINFNANCPDRGPPTAYCAFWPVPAATPTPLTP